jgi:hypothetical protein
MAKGRPRHTVGTTMAHIVLPPMSHVGRSPSRCVQSTRIWLTRPASRCHMNCQSVAATKLGTTHGVSIRVRTARWPGNGRLSRRASPRPPPSVPATLTTVYTAVLRRAWTKPLWSGLASSKSSRR